jgi:hypothetical protein
LSFTGSTQVGKILLKEAADQVIRCSMELGGNAPFVVLEDANIEEAVKGLMMAKMRNGGAACTAANRIYVARSVGDKFIAEFSKAMAALKMGVGVTRLQSSLMQQRQEAQRFTSVEQLLKVLVLSILQPFLKSPKMMQFWPKKSLVQLPLLFSSIQMKKRSSLQTTPITDLLVMSIPKISSAQFVSLKVSKLAWSESIADCFRIQQRHLVA